MASIQTLVALIGKHFLHAQKAMYVSVEVPIHFNTSHFTVICETFAHAELMVDRADRNVLLKRVSTIFTNTR